MLSILTNHPGIFSALAGFLAGIGACLIYVRKRGSAQLEATAKELGDSINRLQKGGSPRP